MTNFKKSLFGYSKSDVCEYINNLNEQFSKAIIDKDNSTEEKMKLLHEKIIKLETENEQLKNKRIDLANVIINAEEHALNIKETVSKEAAKLREDLTHEKQIEKDKLSNYRQAIDSLGNTIKQTLIAIDDQISELSEKCNEVAKQ